MNEAKISEAATGQGNDLNTLGSLIYHEVNIKFSFFKGPITNISPYIDCKLWDVYSMIKGLTYKPKTEKLRGIIDKNERDEFKKTFDYVTFSGTFSERNGKKIINRSIWFHVDLDHIGDMAAIQVLVQKVLSKLKPALMFNSPSGDGLKIIFRIDPEAGTHEQFYSALEHYFSDVIKEKIDPSCKDISRACFLPHDPEAYFNPDPDILGNEFLETFCNQVCDQVKSNQNSMVHNVKPKDVMETPLRMIRNSIDGKKHSELRNASRLMGGFIAGGQVDETEAIKLLEAEIQEKPINSFLVAKKTIIDGIQNGKLDPISPQNNTNSVTQYFQTRTIGEVFEAGMKEPDRLRIFGDFLRQQTNTLLYSNANYGKSILAFQIAVSAATGNSFADCEAFRNECPPMRVLLADFEMDAKTLLDRHAAVWKHYDNTLLNTNLIVIHENPEAKAFYGSDLLQRIEAATISANADLVIIDNLTKVCPDLLKADEVSKVIDTLRRIRHKTGASFLVLGHTRKSMQNVAITENSYYGSAHIANFFTEMFYLDKTNDGNFFLKHSKTKHKDTWTDTVPVLSRGSHERDGLGFSFINLQLLASVQLANSSSSPKKKPSEFKAEIKKMAASGMPQTKIAEIFDCSRSAINQLLSDPILFKN